MFYQPLKDRRKELAHLRPTVLMNFDVADTAKRHQVVCAIITASAATCNVMRVTGRFSVASYATRQTRSIEFSRLHICVFWENSEQSILVRNNRIVRQLSSSLSRIYSTCQMLYIAVDKRRFLPKKRGRAKALPPLCNPMRYWR